MGTRDAVVAALADRLESYDVVVEVGVGERPDVAAALAERGVAVTATDVTEPRRVADGSFPEGVAFVRDDVTDPDPGVYADADVVYALNCPPELQRPLVDVARDVGVDAAFTTLGADPAVVPAAAEALPGVRETLYVASARGGPGP
ncbi:UPF0146 family protein [Halorubellus litoreus]|uniref:UPF0146 protein ACFQGB_01315 n=1 Tax=Halorubellus litoreus TaxID=755308 RepID=A0ABD5VD73_9EURY